MGTRHPTPGRALLESAWQLTGDHIPGRRRAVVRDLCGLGMDAWRAHLLAPDPAAPAGTLTVTWLGVAGLLLDDGTTRLLVDPMVSRPPGWRVGAGLPIGPDAVRIGRCGERLGLTRGVAAVLLGHTHYDHALDAAAFAIATEAVLVGSESAANLGRGAGLPEGRLVVARPRRVERFGAFEVRFLPSVHGLSPRGEIPYPGPITAPLAPPAPAAAWTCGEVFALEIRHPQGSLIQQGSAAVGADTLDGVRVDVAMPCLAWRRSTAQVVDSLVAPVGATRLLPLHLDTLFGSLEGNFRPLPSVDLRGFFRDIDALGLDPLVACLPRGVPVPLMAPKARAG